MSMTDLKELVKDIRMNADFASAACSDVGHFLFTALSRDILGPLTSYVTN